uniref:Hypoxanthine phosphoribosyltransferase n=1 Tax=Spongospora subterranea TaxID=70186 RepID=A0A0H5RCJ9_9EUKA|eukprot:CRZ11476.1 hypothetical protein [Spongospora subterranea]
MQQSTPRQPQRLAVDKVFFSALHDFSNILKCRLPLLVPIPDDGTDTSELSPEEKLQLIEPCPPEWSRNLDKVLWTGAEIQSRVKQMAIQISQDYVGEKIIAIGLLNGAVLFASDLLRHLTIAYELDFMALSSYHGTNSTGNVLLKKDISIDTEGRHVLIIEDLIDTGATLLWLQNHLAHKKAKSIRIACLLDKKVKRVSDVNVDYIGWECPDEFVVGYGMDLDREYRCLPFIGVLNPNALPQ